MARQAQEPESLHYSTGAPWTARPGDWIITLGTELIEVVPDRDFAKKFAVIEDGMVLTRATCGRIEAITGIGTAQSPDRLLAALDRLAKISIGEVKIDFTPGQLEEIKHRATKRGQTVEQTVQAIVDRIKDELFFHS